jgi:extradiol dioxygenase
MDNTADIGILSLGMIGIETRSPGSWRDFACDILGLGVSGTQDTNAPLYLRLDDRHHRIAVHLGDREAIAYLAWEVKDSVAFERAVGLLRERVDVRMGNDAECADRKVTAFVSIVDPAGNRHEIYHGAHYRAKSFYPSRRHAGFVTDEEGVGHVVLGVPEMQSFHAFCMNVLGLNLHRIGNTAVKRTGAFYYCSPRHHSLAALEKPGESSVHHLMVQVRDLDDLGVAYDKAMDAGLVRISIGRHPGDQMVSFYVETPSGFMLEYGWGAPRVDDRTREPITTWFGPHEVWGHRGIADLGNVTSWQKS